MSFLPNGYENLKTEKAYLKVSALKKDNRLRIVMRPIAGWIDWLDKKPIRYLPDQKPSQSFDPEKPMKAFWCCYVWDYEQNGLYIMEITQKSIINDLKKYAKDADWGDFTGYDIKISKEGDGMQTKYTTTPIPPKPMGQIIQDALKSSPVRLEALYEGGDPWNDLNATMGITMASPVIPVKVDNLDLIRNAVEAKSLDSSHLEEYIDGHAQSKGKTFIQVIESACTPEVLPKFIELYSRWIKKFSSGDVVAV